MPRLFITALIILLSTIASTAQTIGEKDVCFETNPDHSPDISIPACTLAIQSNELQGEELVAAHVLRGIAYRAIGRYVESENDIQVALEITEEKPPILRMLAWTYREQGRLAEAENIYTEVLDIDQHWQGWLSRCVVRSDLGRYEDAILDCDEAMAQSQKDTSDTSGVSADILFFKSFALNELQRYDEAYEAVSAGLSLEDVNGRLYFQALIALWNSGRYDDAYTLLEEGMSRYPNDPDIKNFMERAGIE